MNDILLQRRMIRYYNRRCDTSSDFFPFNILAAAWFLYDLFPISICNAFIFFWDMYDGEENINHQLRNCYVHLNLHERKVYFYANYLKIISPTPSSKNLWRLLFQNEVIKIFSNNQRWLHRMVFLGSAAVQVQ